MAQQNTVRPGPISNLSCWPPLFFLKSYKNGKYKANWFYSFDLSRRFDIITDKTLLFLGYHNLYTGIDGDSLMQFSLPDKNILLFPNQISTMTWRLERKRVRDRLRNLRPGIDGERDGIDWYLSWKQSSGRWKIVSLQQPQEGSLNSLDLSMPNSLIQLPPHIEWIFIYFHSRTDPT